MRIGVVQKGPCVFGRDGGVSYEREFGVSGSGFYGVGKQVAQYIDVFPSEGFLYPLCLCDSAKVDNGGFKVVRHAGDSFGTDDVHV